MRKERDMEKIKIKYLSDKIERQIGRASCRERV